MNRRNFLATIIAAVVGAKRSPDWAKTLRNFLNGIDKPVYTYQIPRGWRSPVESPIRWPYTPITKDGIRIELLPWNAWDSKSQFFLDELNAINIPIVPMADAREILGLPKENS